MNITGSLIEAYIFCPRQAWLLSRQLSGNQYNEFLAIGRLIDEESYKRDKKEIITGGGKIDLIRNDNGEITVIEVKKSDKFLKEAKMQLLFYLWKLKEKGVNATGELRIPESKKIINVSLSEKSIQELKEAVKSLENVIGSDEIPPKLNKGRSKCKNCSYFEFCWS